MEIKKSLLKNKRNIVLAGLAISGIAVLSNINLNTVLYGPVTYRWVIIGINALGVYLLLNKQPTTKPAKEVTPFETFEEE